MDSVDSVSPNEPPAGLSPPCDIGGATVDVMLLTGEAELKQPTLTRKGDAKIVLDTLPRPLVRFEFSPQVTGEKNSQFLALKRAFEGHELEEGTLVCQAPFGEVSAHPTNVTNGDISGLVSEAIGELKGHFDTAKYVVVNGPLHRGSPIRRERSVFVGRYSVRIDDAEVVIDRLSSSKPSPRSVFSFTHVAEIRFAKPERLSRFHEIAATVFWCLSLMRGGWVGVVGPWLYSDGSPQVTIPRVTKTSPNRHCQNWCPELVMGTIDSLLPCLHTAFQDKEKKEALLTGLHWLVETEQCAGGVEGSLVLQQAALEALAWYEIVQNRKLSSVSAFEGVSATEKIRTLLALFKIPADIPAHCEDLVAYATDHPQSNDLPALLVDVRNALIHGKPSKVQRLFGRARGEDERAELYQLTTGLLEQAVLAIAGFQGKILRRDTTAEWTSGAIKHVPWA